MKQTPDDEQLAAAVRVLIAAGGSFVPPAESEVDLSVGQVKARLGCGDTYVRAHLGEFPGAYRLPGGEIRIPARDVEALRKRTRLRRNA